MNSIRRSGTLAEILRCNRKLTSCIKMNDVPGSIDL